MLKKRILALLLAIAVLSGLPALAAAGSQSDPLVSLSYARSWGQTMLDGAVPSINSTLTPFYETASAGALRALSAGKGAEAVALENGGTLKMATGASVTLLSGTATVKLDSGDFVNVTVGSAAGNGKLNRYHLYIVCENGSATVTATSASLFVVDGSFTRTAGRAAFSDVKTADWFYSDVYNAVDMGLITGMTSTSFQPGGYLTVAQALVLCARMNQLYQSGEVTLTGSGAQWYKPYVDYAVENSLVEQSYASLTEAQYNAPVTRREYIHIFYKALPQSEYAAINELADDSIPDVKLGDSYAAEIYAFYRAGILTGVSNTSGVAEHSFLPDTGIVRSEVAAALTRMFDSTTRKSFTIG